MCISADQPGDLGHVMGQLQGRKLLIQLAMSAPSAAALVQVPPQSKHVLCFLGRQQKTELILDEHSSL